MNTSQLKSFAQQSRKSLMDTVSGKLDYVLDENSLARRESASAVSALEGLIKEIGKEQVIEKVAYTWFNRFCALRYMDVNRYNKIGIVSPVEGQTQPEILAEAKMNYIDDSIVTADKIADIRNLLNGTKTSKDPQGEAYKLLFVSYCNSLNKQLPFMFEKISDYTELLLPDDLLAQNSVLSNTIEVLDAEACKDIEVIGWLYQYYISEKKDEVFAELKKGKKISKENVPAATQIFTPKWIVSYMVENSVGKLWLESHPDERLQSQFKYYLESAEQEPEVQAKLDDLINKDLKPQDIKVLDPACGSGHILVKAFDVLFEIYKSQGWQENEIPEMILKNNLYGLDICDRAAQLAQFAVMMKARAFDRNIFNKVKELNICSIKDTNWMDSFVASEIISKCDDKEQAKEQVELLQSTFRDAKEYGSILEVKDIDFDFWNKYLLVLKEDGQIRTCTPIIKGRLPFILKQAKIMQQKYECVIANPPYMGGTMGRILAEFLKDVYPDTKSDLFAVFMEKFLNKTTNYLSMVTPESWMFLPTYLKLRENIFESSNINNLLHLGKKAFDCGFGTTTFSINKKTYKNYKAKYVNLKEIDPEKRYLNINNNKLTYITDYSKFKLLPNYIVAYWCSDEFARKINKANKFADKYQLDCGIKTGKNEVFLRLWHEVALNKISTTPSLETLKTSKFKWYFYNKGGGYRKWYGNYEYVVELENNASRIKNMVSKDTYRLRNQNNYFKKGILWPLTGDIRFSCRYLPDNILCDVASNAIYFYKEYDYMAIAYMNSCIFNFLLNMINPTTSYPIDSVGNVLYIPCNNEKIVNNAQENIKISKDDWDSFETSWDFQEHPLLRFRSKFSQGLADDLNKSEIIHIKPLANGDFRQYNWAPNDKIEECFLRWKEYKQEQFNKLKANEEELNRLFIEIYGLKDEMDEKVEDKDITLKGSLETEKDCIKSLLSYAVGCMFGRYSLDEKGLTFAGGEFNLSKYKSFPADEDAVIPVLSEHLFSDDITSRFKEFLKVAFGKTYFEENLEYVASVLGKKNTETADDTIRNYFMKDFYNDHIKMYQKRPIYWMFSSPKGNFNALVYMHRYNKDTASVILNSYLRNYRDEKLKAQIENCKQIELSASTSQGDKIKASKRREELEKIVKEVTDYERDILYPLATERKEIDLDDGVKVNYLKFGKALKDFGLKAKK